MKNNVVYPAALFFLLILAQSCKKDSQDNFTAPAQANQYINASVSSGQTFTFNAGSSGILSVSQQASHYQVSKTGTENGSAIYSYNSITGYAGLDEVTLTYTPIAKSENNSGCPANHNDAASSIINIKLNVTN